MEQGTQNRESWLGKRLVALDALYRKFGRDGLKEQPLADVRLLLASKELELRDAARGRDLTDHQKMNNRQLELEVKDLSSYLKGQLSMLNLSDLRSFRQAGRERQNEPQKRREVDFER